MKNNIKTTSVILFIFLVTIKGFSQVNNNSLFLLVDKEKDSVYFLNDEEGDRIRYDYPNEKQNWQLYLQHAYFPNYKGNSFRYLLPKEMMSEYIRRGNMQEIKPFFKKLDSLDRGEVSKYIRLHYPPYFYEYLDGQKFRTQRRRNIFFVFKSDLEEKYVTCYEVSLNQTTMLEE